MTEPARREQHSGRRGVARLATGEQEPGWEGPPTGGDDLDQAISVLRGRIDEEFQISQRLDSKNRQVFALAAGFFAVIQTVAFSSFAQQGVTEAERAGLLACVIVAGALVAWVAHRATGAEDLREAQDIRPSAIVQWANEAGGDPEYVRSRIVGQLAEVAQDRADRNEERANHYDKVVEVARWALIAAGVELIVAIVVRL